MLGFYNLKNLENYYYYLMELKIFKKENIIVKEHVLR